jgi:hypothetical protein
MKSFNVKGNNKFRLLFIKSVRMQIYDNRTSFVVGTQNKLGEEIHFLTVFAFGFRLVGKGGTQILDALGIFPAVK